MKGKNMDAEQVANQIETCVDALNTCQEYVKENNPYEAVYWFKVATRLSHGIRPKLEKWEKQEEEKEQEKKGTKR